MKQYPLIFFLFLLFHNSTAAQTCFPNGITFISQSDVDLFPQYYPDCTIIGGDLRIMSSGITNIDSLYNITKVMGELNIYQTNLSSLQGLHNLDTVYHTIEIRFSNNLTNLEGLNSLKDFGCYGDTCTGSYFRVGHCDNLVNLEGLESLKHFSSLVFQSNASMLSLEGLDSIQSVGSLRIEQCDALQSLSGIETLEELDHLKIWFCDNIEGLTSLPNITNLERIEVWGNPSLENLDGLDSLITMNAPMYGSSEVYINDNASLSNISAIGNADLSFVTDLEIEENPMLGVCAYPAICDYIDSDNDVSIRNNMPGCNGIVELIGLCCAQDTTWCPPSTTICFENGIEFGSQSDVDAFPGTYPNCTTIGGDLSIVSNNIISIDSLYNITKVMGELNIYQTNLSSLQGLHNLDTVYHTIEIRFSNNLTNLEGLNSLKDFGCYGDTCTGSYFRVGHCDNLVNLEGLESLKHFSSLVFQSNASMLSLEGLDSIQSVGSLRIEQCDALQSLSGIETLEELDHLKIWFCDNIEGLTSLPNITNLERIEVWGNPSLENLDGLDSLITMNAPMYGSGKVYINDNASLNNISAIGMADLSFVTVLEIEENPMLGVCAYPAICDYIDSDNEVSIRNNMSGCNGIVELIGLCCAQDTTWCPPSTTICFENGIEFGSQSDVDAFPGSYPNCTTIGGDLSIVSSDITNIDSLYNITKVMGELNIYQTNLSSLQGLHNLDTVYHTIEIRFSNNLTNLEGLNSLKDFGCYGDTCTGSYFRVGHCDNLVNLEGLESLKHFSSLVFQSNASMLSLEGLDSIQSVGSLRIEQCDALQSLSGIETLEELDHLKIWFCDNIVELTSLPNVTNLGKIEVWGNPSLENLDGLDSLIKMDVPTYGYSEVYINDNASLNSISAIGNADFSSVVELEIQGNPMLGVCGYPSICNYISDQNNAAVIGGNSLGCNGLIELEKDCQDVLFIFEVEESTTNLLGSTTTNYWHDPLNWRNNSIPNDSSYVIIPHNLECVIQQDSIAHCKDLLLYQGAQIRCELNSELKIFDE
ncbi:MAG: leucine-rich repeat protein [Saprospiraceae bacterium]|nr:leucine-rich repeat protein [Saprospiraceae bacterium]